MFDQPQSVTRLLYEVEEAHVERTQEVHVEASTDAGRSYRSVQVERLPNKKLPPRPLWLAWIGGPLPADLSSLWRWHLRRFTVDHAFRFFKQTLGWTTIRPRYADAANRWTWLIAGACWQLWLARTLVGEVRLRGNIHERTDCSLQVKSIATSPEYWSG